MIGYIQGKVQEHEDGKVLINTQFAEGGIGYLVSVPQSAEYGSIYPGQKIELYIYTHVREDALDLFGFSTRGEKELFLSLLSVGGIGPKSALGILSRVAPALLVNAILTGDKDSLIEVPGIGKKTAERIVLELGDSFRKKKGPIGATSAQTSSLPASSLSSLSIMKDARDALLGLGFREAQVMPLLNRLASEAKPGARPEDLIRETLRQLQ